MRSVSVIIPVYKVSEYVERCIFSVMEQTYTDIECIIVDDSSPDDSISKCQKLINSYSGPIEFKILHHECNRGLSAARNTGTDAATGEYIYYLDSDDEITPDCISLLIKETEHHPEVELVQGGVKTIPHNPWLDLSYFQNSYYVDSNVWIRFNFLKKGEEFPTISTSKLVRKDFLATNHITFKEGLIHEDELWTLQIVRKLSKIAIIGQPTYIYYKTGNSIMSTLDDRRSARYMIFICRKALQTLNEPYKRLQLYKYFWILLDRIEYGYTKKEGVKAILISILALINCGHLRLAIRSIKYFFYLYTHKRPSTSHLKDDIAALWESETIKIAAQEQSWEQSPLV